MVKWVISVPLQGQKSIAIKILGYQYWLQARLKYFFGQQDLFFKEINIFVHKRDSNDIYNVAKKLIFVK